MGGNSGQEAGTGGRARGITWHRRAWSEGLARRGEGWRHVVRKKLCMGGVSEGRGQGRGELETRDTEKLCVGGVRKGRGQERWELAGIGRKDGLEEGN